MIQTPFYFYTNKYLPRSFSDDHLDLNCDDMIYFIQINKSIVRKDYGKTNYTNKKRKTYVI